MSMSIKGRESPIQTIQIGQIENQHLGASKKNIKMLHLCVLKTRTIGIVLAHLQKQPQCTTASVACCRMQVALLRWPRKLLYNNIISPFSFPISNLPIYYSLFSVKYLTSFFIVITCMQVYAYKYVFPNKTCLVFIMSWSCMTSKRAILYRNTNFCAFYSLNKTIIALP